MRKRRVRDGKTANFIATTFSPSILKTGRFSSRGISALLALLLAATALSSPALANGGNGGASGRGNSGGIGGGDGADGTTPGDGLFTPSGGGGGGGGGAGGGHGADGGLGEDAGAVVGTGGQEELPGRRTERPAIRGETPAS
ncbi:hypothetical protein [Tardiphaga alba]|uniref:hypothetical protein n=1 Tax=Tardiphaga alba TaxID=340268 RepID=UPI001BA96D59|nr:hypothetical protein [Tardiphaga alba]